VDSNNFSKDQLISKFSAGQEGNIIYVSVVKGDKSADGLLTRTQVTSGLNHNNQDAAGSGWGTFGTDGTVTVYISGFSASQKYTVYTVARNGKTTENNGVYSDVTDAQVVTTSAFDEVDDDDDEDDDDETPGPGPGPGPGPTPTPDVDDDFDYEEGAMHLACSVLLLLLALI
jgi:hypothetical protein